MYWMLSVVISLTFIAIGGPQQNRSSCVKTGNPTEVAIDTTINISRLLRDKTGASVFGGKFKYTTVEIHMQPGSHTLYAAGMNGKLRYLYAIDKKKNKIPATTLQDLLVRHALL